MIRPLVAQTFDSSSIATSVINALAPIPPYSSSYMIPKRSFSRKSSTTSHGNSARLVDLGGPRRDPLARERADELADLPLLVGQRIDGAHGGDLVAAPR